MDIIFNMNLYIWLNNNLINKIKLKYFLNKFFKLLKYIK